MLNKVILQGRLTQDPEIKTTPAGVSVASFSLAVERDYQKDGEKQTDFINIVAWRSTADFIGKYFSKGKMMIVCGSLQVRNYTTQSGEKRYVTEVIAESVNFGGDKQETQKNGNFEANNGVSIKDVEVTPDIADFEEYTDSDDLPF